MKTPQHIIWDYNGTLLDDLDHSIKTVNQILEKHSLKTTTNDFHINHFDVPIEDYYIKLGFDLNNTCFNKLALEFITLYNEGLKDLKLFPETPSVLKFIKDKNITQSLLSAREEQDLIKELKTFGIADFFAAIFGASNHRGSGKTQRGKELIEHLGLNPDTTLLIGDMAQDHEVAKKLGIKCLLLSSGHNSHKRLEQTGRPVLENLNSLMNYLS